MRLSPSLTRALTLTAVAAVGAASCVAPHPGLPTPVCPTGVPRWSESGTWPGGTVPADGADVVVPAGETIALDTNTAALGSLTISGTLEVCRQATELRSDWIMVHGTLRAGTAAAPFREDLTLTLTGADTNESVMTMGTRGLLVMGGHLELYGDAPQTAWTRLTAHVPAGGSMLQLETAAVDWRVGDELAVTNTDWHGTAHTERRTIGSISPDGHTVTLSTPLTAPRWGLLQHVTSEGLSLAPANDVTPPATPTPLVLDERAEVANLTRNIVIQAPDDNLWQTQGFGAHVMVMDLASSVQIDGVQFRRVGQRARLGRYPMHWHRLSYDNNGAMVGDASGQFLRSSTITDSTNRCITLHATNGLTVQDNICVDITGHGVFLEDAVERRNVIEGNLVAAVHNTAATGALKVHEIEGSSGMWLSNPDNTVRGNVVSDADGFGYWMGYPQHPVGPSANVPLRPDRTLFGVFEDNVTHSNGREGVMLDNAETDNAGNFFPRQYYSTTDGQDPQWPYPTLRRFSIEGLVTYKNQYGGFWNRVTRPDYTEFVSADNEDRYFAGAGADGVITRSLVIGTSLNSATPRPHANQVPTAFASYHSAFDMRENVVVNFPMVSGSRSGMFATDDYYLTPVDKGHIRNPGNLMINTDPGYRSPRPSPSYALAGALWDPHGTWGPAGRYFVYDDPFLTHGTTCSPVQPAGSNGVSCEGPYYGVAGFVLEQANERYNARMPIDVTRYSNAGVAVGQWNVADGNLISAFSNMRHFAAQHESRFLLDFPAAPTPNDVGLSVENALTTGDTFVLGVRFSGANPAQVYGSTYWNYFDPAHAASADSAIKHNYTAVASLAAVQASAGETFWQDTTNNIVWMKVRGGLAQTWNDADYPAHDDHHLYRTMNIRVH